jgi:hypothetical protein
MNNIFLLRAVEFQSQKEDPFKFDSVAEKIAGKYIPFSGVIQKPSYLLFIAYVNSLFKENKIHCHLTKQKDIKTRLEKLLVYSWKRSTSKLPTGIIGSRIWNINPFEAKDGNWVVQDCFKIYESSSKKFDFENILNFYQSKNGEEIKGLNEFLNRSGHLASHKKYVDMLLSKLKKKNHSFFCGNTKISNKLKEKFRKSLKDVIEEKSFSNDKVFISKLFKSVHPWDVIEKVLKSPDYPFKDLNNWFTKFVLAVDGELNGKNSNNLWKDADKAFEKMDKKLILNNRPDPVCWFEKNNGAYKKFKDFNDAGWNALLRRAKKGNGLYYNYRLRAFSSLLEESINE